MWHRFQLKSDDGFDFGYQWLDCDLEQFTNIATGTPVVGDAEAQARDGTDAQCHTPQYRTVYYVAVFDQDTADWTDSVADPAAAYVAWGQEQAGA